MNEMGTIQRDFSTPLIDRSNKNARKWYRENLEKAVEYNARHHKKHRLEINPKWGLCYGGR